MKTKQMLITPITPEGQVSPAPILVRKGVIVQAREFIWDFTRNILAIYGLISLIGWLL